MSNITAITYCGMGHGKVEVEHFNTCDGAMMHGREWQCECGKTVDSLGGHDVSCDCGREYNGFGQRLRSNWRDNPSNYDENIGDLEGYEMACLAGE